MHNEPNEFVVGNFTHILLIRLSSVDEYQFKRKRIRLRTLDPQEMEAVLSLNQASEARIHSELVLETAALPEPSTPSPALPDNPGPPSPETSSENIITIERFLRRSVQTVPTTKKALPDGVSLKKSRAYTHRRATERRAMRERNVTKMLKRPRESSRIAKSLFRAAVLTNGDPLDALVDDAGISLTRRPLKFVPFNKFATPSRPGQTDSVERSDLGRGEDPMQRTRRHGKASNLKQHLPTSQLRVPLCLVPLQEAEAAYSVMFP